MVTMNITPHRCNHCSMVKPISADVRYSGMMTGKPNSVRLQIMRTMAVIRMLR
ncbi:hypothetical protein D3C85_1782490 [compost metagenome]